MAAQENRLAAAEAAFNLRDRELKEREKKIKLGEVKTDSEVQKMLSRVSELETKSKSFQKRFEDVSKKMKRYDEGPQNGDLENMERRISEMERNLKEYADEQTKGKSIIMYKCKSRIIA